MGSRYIIVSPVKDEAKFIEHTLRSVVSQTVKPVRWVIVDDGSTDDTPALVRRYQAEHSFIHLLQIPPGRPRQPGSGVIRAFSTGFETIKSLDFDYIVKLDCDLSFEADYFERLLAEFTSDSRLGIASGIYKESKEPPGWEPVPMPSYHAAGASKVVRRECFQQIGGFVAARGWDTVDEIRAINFGWKTRHFENLVMKHLKPEGAGIGQYRTAKMHGEIYYLTGGGTCFFVLKAINRARSSPALLGGMAMVWGYVLALFTRKQRLVSPEEARCYRSLLNQRIVNKLRRTSAIN